MSHASFGASIHVTACASVALPGTRSYVAYSPGPSASNTCAPDRSTSAAVSTSGCSTSTLVGLPSAPGMKKPLNRSAFQVHVDAASPIASQLTAALHTTGALLTSTSAIAHSCSQVGA